MTDVRPRQRTSLWQIVTASTAIVVLILCFIAPRVSYADVDDFTVTSFTADDTLTNTDPQGELHIVEHISVDFDDQDHGILRAIPDSYKGHRLQLHVNAVTSSSGAPSSYTTYSQNGNTVLRIGDPNTTVTGNQEYTIDYTVRNVITFYNDHDELYWNINGDQWDEPFDDVQVTLHLPGGLKLSNNKPVCYAGAYGSTAQQCFVERPNAQTITAQTTNGLSADQTLSLVAGFQKGYFHPSTWYETLGEYTGDIIAFLIPLLLIGGGSGLLWFYRGRDPKGRGVIVPEYDAPDGLSPIEVGTLIDFRTDNKDITATIIAMAIRGYIQIIEQSKKGVLHKKKEYSLKLLNTSPQGLNPFEITLRANLFDRFEVGEEVPLTALKYKLAKVADRLRRVVSNTLLSNGYFKSNKVGLHPINARATLMGSAVLIIIVLVNLHVPLPAAFGVFVGAIIAIFFMWSLASRTEKGVVAKEHALGLKMYMKVAEADRIKMLQSPDAKYAEKSDAPKRTVDLFEKLLPYAMVLGVEKEWATKFEDIYLNPPQWYSGNWATFNILYLTSSLSDGMAQQVTSAFTSQSSAGGSGFGGGFAGGGGGGGGGGGW